MLPSRRVFITFLVLIVVLGGFYLLTQWVSKTTGFTVGESEQVKLAQCLSFHEARVYLPSECKNCQEQSDILGSGVKYLEVIDCSKAGSGCANIDKIIWEINGTRFNGIKTLSELKNLSGCNVQ